MSECDEYTPDLGSIRDWYSGAVDEYWCDTGMSAAQAMERQGRQVRRIDEIRERLDKARPGLGEIDGGEELLKRRGNPKGLYTWTLYGTYADAILLVNARNDLAWLLDVLASRDQRCEDLAVSLDETRASLDAAIAAAAIQREIDKRPCPTCGGDPLRPAFDGRTDCHAPWPEEDQTDD